MVAVQWNVRSILQHDSCKHQAKIPPVSLPHQGSVSLAHTFRFLDLEWVWLKPYEMYEMMGSDAFFVVSYKENMLYVSDATALDQITKSRVNFPKPTRVYKLLEIFGTNVVTTEGSVWRHHRKITSTPFTEKSNLHDWEESIHQTQSMITAWMGSNTIRSDKITKLSPDIMRLTLHVIGRAGFGVHMLWPHEQKETKESSDLGGSSIWPGHKMSFYDSLNQLLHNIQWVLIVPDWLRPHTPWKTITKTDEAYKEYGVYMNEIYAQKKQDIREGKTWPGLDMLGAFTRGAGMDQEALLAEESKDPEKGDKRKYLLTDSEIIGNTFLFMVAGHETVAHTLVYTILSLASHPWSQRRMQEDLDSIFNGRKPDQWSYDDDLPKLFGSLVGATFSEQLRLIPPVIAIPKSTEVPQPLRLNDGTQAIIPANTNIHVHAIGAHRNPNNWNGATDLNEFKPERWLPDRFNSVAVNGSADNHAQKNDKITEAEDAEPEYAAPGENVHASFLKPRRGAYLPFSEGARACLGRRFAQVEALAVLAVLFSEWSVELDTSDYIVDEALDAMTADDPERRKYWEKARSNCQWVMKEGSSTVLTVAIRRGVVPLRLVKRGEERFAWKD